MSIRDEKGSALLMSIVVTTLIVGMLLAFLMLTALSAVKTIDSEGTGEITEPVMMAGENL